MKDEIQNAGDHSQQIQAARDVNQNNIFIVNMGKDELRSFLTENAALDHSPATPVGETERHHRDKFNATFSETAASGRPDIPLDKYSSLRALNLIKQAQDSYIASGGDEDLAEQLSMLIVEIVDSPPRSLRDCLLRESALCLPKLSSRHVNVITANFILGGVHLGSDGTIDGVLDRLEAVLEPLADLPAQRTEIEYIASCGAGTTALAGIGPTYIDAIRNTYKYEMQTPRERSDFPESLNESLFVKVEDGKVILHPRASELQGEQERNAKRTGSRLERLTVSPRNSPERQLQQAIKSIKRSDEDVAEVFESRPVISSTVATLDKIKASDLTLNEVGRAIAILKWNTFDPNAFSLEQLIERDA